MMSCCVEWRLLVLASILWSYHVGWSLPLSPPNIMTPRRSFIMSMKPCQDAIGNVGICMFKWDCISQNGITLSTCVDGFLFGACCKLKVTTQLAISETITIANDIDVDESIGSNIPHFLPPQLQNTKYFSHTTKNSVPLRLVSSNAGTESNPSSVSSHFLPLTEQLDHKNLKKGINISTSNQDPLKTNNYAEKENNFQDLSTLSAEFDNLSTIDEFLENSSLPEMKNVHLDDERKVFTTKMNVSIGIESSSTTTEASYQLANNTGIEAFILPFVKNNTISTDHTNNFSGTKNSITLSDISPTISHSLFEYIINNNGTSVSDYGLLFNHSGVKYTEEEVTYSTQNINSSSITDLHTEVLDETMSTKSHELFSLSEEIDLENRTKFYSNFTDSEKNSSFGEIDDIFDDETGLPIFSNGDNSSEILDISDFLPDYSDDIISSEAGETLESWNTDIYENSEVYASQKLESVHELKSTIAGNTDFFTEILTTGSTTKNLNNISDIDEIRKTSPVLFNSTAATMRDDNLIDTTIKEHLSSLYLGSTAENLSSDTPKINDSIQTKSPLQISNISDIARTLLRETTNEMLVSTLSDMPCSTQSELFDTTVENLETHSNAANSIDFIASLSKVTASLVNNVTEFPKPWANNEKLENKGILKTTTKTSFKTTNFVNSEIESDFLVPTYILSQTTITKSKEDYKHYDSNSLLTNKTSNSSLNTEPNNISPLSNNKPFDFTTSNPNLFSDLNTTTRYMNLTSSTEDINNTVSTTVQPHTSTMIDEPLNVESLTSNIQDLSNNTLNKTGNPYNQHNNIFPSNLSESNKITDIAFSTSAEDTLEYIDSQNNDNINSTEESNIQSAETIFDTSHLHELTSIDIAQTNFISSDEDGTEISETTKTTLYPNTTYSVIVHFAQDSTTNNFESPTTPKSDNFLVISNQTTSTSNLLADVNLTTESVSVSISSSSNSSPISTNSADEIISTFISPVANNSQFILSVLHSELATSSHTPVSHQKPTPPSPTWNYGKECGIRLLRPSGRIVGGQNTYFGKWPWQALVKEATWLGLFVKNKCGGVLINSKYVITAAHCQPGFLATLVVVLGAHDLAGTMDTKSPIARNVRRMVIHRHYNPLTFENDLALLEMESPVEFLPHVVPICLPHRNEEFTGKMAFVTGWGKLTHGGDVPNILQEVQVPIVTNGECQRMFLYAGHQKAIRSNFVCAGYRKGGQDSCEGDSGGPLVVQRDDKRWVLVGTVSHGIGCADPNLPGVYMRMSTYRPWIDSIIKK